MKMLKLIVLSLVVFGGAQSATLTYISSATTNTEAGSLLFAPDTPLFDAAFVYLIQIDSEFDDAVERGFLSNEDEASNEPDNLTTDSEYIRIRPRGPRGIPVPDVSIDSLVPVSANFTKSVKGTGESAGSSFSVATAAVLAAGRGLESASLAWAVTQVISPEANSSSGSKTGDEADAANASLPDRLDGARLRDA